MLRSPKYVKNIYDDLPEGQINDPLAEEMIFGSISPSNSLVSILCVASGAADVQGHRLDAEVLGHRHVCLG